MMMWYSGTLRSVLDIWNNDSKYWCPTILWYIYVGRVRHAVTTAHSSAMIFVLMMLYWQHMPRARRRYDEHDLVSRRDVSRNAARNRVIWRGDDNQSLLVSITLLFCAEWWPVVAWHITAAAWWWCDMINRNAYIRWSCVLHAARVICSAQQTATPQQRAA